MSGLTSHIKLYGGKSNRFEQIKEELSQDLGYEPSNPEVVGMLMASWGQDRVSSSASTRNVVSASTNGSRR